MPEDPRDHVRLLIGETANVEKRVARHNAGIGCGFTSGRTPVALVYTASLPDQPAARARARPLKRWTATPHAPARSTSYCLLPLAEF